MIPKYLKIKANVIPNGTWWLALFLEVGHLLGFQKGVVQLSLPTQENRLKFTTLSKY